MESPNSGVFAALATPIDTYGKPDANAFACMIDFAVERGVDGLVIGGGTAEYPHFTVEERSTLIAQAVRRLQGRRIAIASIGTSSIHSTLRLACCAVDCGADVLLVPPPYFFRYEREDLVSFCKERLASFKKPEKIVFLPELPRNPLGKVLKKDLKQQLEA